MVVAVAAAAVLPGLGGIRYPFLHDDRWAVVDNPVVRDGVDPLRILSTNAWGDSPDHRHILNYRPLSVASLAFTHAAAGLDPLPYRLANLLLHALVSTLVLALALRLRVRRLPAFAAALWFATHPVHSEAIFFAVNREELLCAAFFLFALMQATPLSSLPGPQTPARTGRAYFLVTAATGLALLSKETAGILPILLIVVYLTWPPHVGQRRAAITMVVATAAILAGYLILRFTALGRLAAGYIPWQDNPLVRADLFDRLASSLALIWQALGLLIAPLWLTVDYGFDTLGLPAGSPTAATWLGLATVGVVVAAFLHYRRTAPSVSLGLAILAFAWSPVSNILFPNSIIFAERLLYLPSAGAALVVAGVLDRIRDSRPLSHPAAWAPVAIILIIATLSGLVLADRNRDYRSGRALFDSSLAAHPRSTRLWNNLAIEYQNDGEWDRSGVALERALAIDPTNAEAHNNLGLVQARRGEMQDAARSFGTALDLRPGMASALGNLCKLFESLPDVARTRAICEMAVRRGAPVEDVLARLRERSDGPQEQ